MFSSCLVYIIDGAYGYSGKHASGLLSFNYSSRMLSSLLACYSTIGKVFLDMCCVDIIAPFITEIFLV